MDVPHFRPYSIGELLFEFDTDNFRFKSLALLGSFDLDKISIQV